MGAPRNRNGVFHAGRIVFSAPVPIVVVFGILSANRYPIVAGINNDLSFVQPLLTMRVLDCVDFYLIAVPTHDVGSPIDIAQRYAAICRQRISLMKLSGKISGMVPSIGLNGE